MRFPLIAIMLAALVPAWSDDVGLGPIPPTFQTLGALAAPSGFKVTGAPSGGIGSFTGAGIEMSFSAGAGNIYCFDRGGSVYDNLTIMGNTMSIGTWGVTGLYCDVNAIPWIGGTNSRPASTFAGCVVWGVENASADTVGQVGEVLSGNVSAYANMAATATYGQITSVALTAGDWNIEGYFTISGNAATLTATADTLVAISSTTASAAGTTEGLGDLAHVSQVFNASGKQSVALHKHVNVSSATTYFLNAQATYTAGTPQAVGSLLATRIR